MGGICATPDACVKRPLQFQKADFGLQTHTMPTPAASGLKILLVDDNEDASLSMAELLQLYGYEVRTAANGGEALRLAAEFEPQLVLSDIGLPGMNGYELARALRREAGERRIALAAVTGYGQSGDRARALEAGFDHFLVKPLAADALLKFIHDQFDAN
jgi:CheY-like chemotaxis protein